MYIYIGLFIGISHRGTLVGVHPIIPWVLWGCVWVVVVGWSGGIGVKYPQSFDGRTTGMGDDFFILRIFASLGIDIIVWILLTHVCFQSVGLLRLARIHKKTLCISWQTVNLYPTSLFCSVLKNHVLFWIKTSKSQWFISRLNFELPLNNYPQRIQATKKCQGSGVLPT